MAKTGDIFVATWGYDQTNADFFQVIGTTGKSVRVRHIQKKITEDKGGFMTGHAIPTKNSFDGEAMTKRIYIYEGEERFQAGESMGSAELWKGSPVAISWYA